MGWCTLHEKEESTDTIMPFFDKASIILVQGTLELLGQRDAGLISPYLRAKSLETIQWIAALSAEKLIANRRYIQYSILYISYSMFCFIYSQ